MKLRTIKNPDLPILIVDDNVQYTQVLKRILEKIFGYKSIFSMDNTYDAFAEISKEPDFYKILFIDYNFPGGETGGSFLNRLSNKKLLEGKVAFMITSEPTADNLKEAQAAGAIGMVAKPFDRNDLQRQLDKAERALSIGDADSF